MKFDIPQPHFNIVRTDIQNLVLCAGRRFGKTQYVILPRIARHLSQSFYNRLTGELLPHKIGYYMITFKQATDIFWDRAKEAFKDIIRKTNETKCVITFVNGGQLQLFGTDMNPDNLRGPYRTMVIRDEAAHQDEETFEKILQPMMLDVSGQLLDVSSPNGFNQFYKHHQRGQQNRPNWKSFTFPSLAGGFITPEELEDIKKDCTEEYFRQEYLAEFVGRTGRIYYGFDRTRHITKIVPQPELACHLAFDFNMVPAVHMACIQQIGEISYIFDEICIGDTPHVIAEFMRRYKPIDFAGIKIYGDASGLRTTIGYSDYQYIQNTLHANGYGPIEIRVNSFNPQVRDRTNHVNTYLINAKGQIRIYVDPGCRKFIRDMEEVMYGDKTGRIDKTSKPELTHISDAFGYYLWVACPSLLYRLAF